MKKAASIFLRADIQHNDLALLIRWLENPGITRYMNEDPTAARQLRQLSASVPAPYAAVPSEPAGTVFPDLPGGRSSDRLCKAHTSVRLRPL